jgi:hypothetical protein
LTSLIFGTRLTEGKKAKSGAGSGVMGSENTTILCTDLHGNQLPSALVQGSDGNFYGTSYSGGSSHNGTVFVDSGILSHCSIVNEKCVFNRHQQIDLINPSLSGLGMEQFEK